MTREYAARPFDEVRRRDRAVDDDAWIEAMLRIAPFGALATVFEGQPFINTNIFAFDEAARVIYMHGAPAGRTRANVERDGRCCFSVSEMGRLVPNERAFNMSVEYAGVAVFGRVRVVEDAVEQERALGLLLDKYFPHLQPGTDYIPSTPDELARTSVYRIEIEQWSGKRKEVEPDSPGAFVYPDKVPWRGP